MTFQKSVLTKNQAKGFRKGVQYQGESCEMFVTIRYDDECGNGHNTFAITGDIRKGRKALVGGCIHDEIRKHFPEFAKYIKWHLTSSDGPMHYIANTVYLAGDRDCNGYRKGEPSSFSKSVKFSGFPVPFTFKGCFIDFLETKPDFKKQSIEKFDHKDSNGREYEPNYDFSGRHSSWTGAAFDSLQEAQAWLKAFRTMKFKIIKTADSWSKGKEREFDAARNTAVWPEATDAELGLPRKQLEKKLRARLPGLMRDFKAAIEELGFMY